MTAEDIGVPGTLPAVIGVRGARHNNLQDIDVDVPLWRTVAVVGVSGSGKTALVLDSLIPAARAQLTGSALPGHVRRLDLGAIRQVVQVDASPIGQNARSTSATFCGAFDQIRRLFAASGYARRPWSGRR